MTHSIRQVMGLFCLSLLTSFSPALADTITVRADSWPPFNDDPASAQPGYVVELMKAIFEPLGHTIDYQTEPWTRAVEDVTAGKIDAVIGASATDAPGCVFPSEPIGIMVNHFYVLKGSAWAFQGVDSLKSIKLGCIEGYAYDEAEIDGYIKSASAPAVQAATGDGALEKNIQKLQASRIDALIEYDPVIKFTMNKMGVAADAIVIAGNPAGKNSPLYVAFTPGKEISKKYAEQFSEGLAKLRSSGELITILDRYQQIDWK